MNILMIDYFQTTQKCHNHVLLWKVICGIMQATTDALQDWKPFLHTITSDNGKEFANHTAIAKELQIDYYFAKPTTVGNVVLTKTQMD